MAYTFFYPVFFICCLILSLLDCFGCQMKKLAQAKAAAKAKEQEKFKAEAKTQENRSMLHVCYWY